MKRNVGRMALVCVVFAAFVLASVAYLHARETEPVEKQILGQLLTAAEDVDYEAFVQNGTPAFKTGITKQMFEGVSAPVSPRMKKGYETHYLGKLKQGGFQVHLWKLTYKDNGDDTLAKLVLQKGKVAGFWLQ